MTAIKQIDPYQSAGWISEKNEMKMKRVPGGTHLDNVRFNVLRSRASG
jgi:hypothetical protein